MLKLYWQPRPAIGPPHLWCPPSPFNAIVSPWPPSWLGVCSSTGSMPLHTTHAICCTPARLTIYGWWLMSSIPTWLRYRIHPGCTLGILVCIDRSSPCLRPSGTRLFCLKLCTLLLFPFVWSSWRKGNLLRFRIPTLCRQGSTPLYCSSNALSSRILLIRQTWPMLSHQGWKLVGFLHLSLSQGSHYCIIWEQSRDLLGGIPVFSSSSFSHCIIHILHLRVMHIPQRAIESFTCFSHWFLYLI